MTEEAPCWLDRDVLAVYISVRVDEVGKLRRVGKLPIPSYHLGPKSPRWDRFAVDACFEGQSPSDKQSHETVLQAAVEAILAEPSRRRRGQ